MAAKREGPEHLEPGTHWAEDEKKETQNELATWKRIAQCWGKEMGEYRKALQKIAREEVNNPADLADDILRKWDGDWRR